MINNNTNNNRVPFSSLEEYKRNLDDHYETMREIFNYSENDPMARFNVEQRSIDPLVTLHTYLTNILR